MPVAAIEPAHYTCLRTRTPLAVDADLSKDARRGGRFDVPEFDLMNALTFGGNYDRAGATFWHGTHPRGCRWAFLDGDFPGMRGAVQVDGKMNDRSVVDKGWSVEIALPWAGMRQLANGRSLPPKNGEVWRMFFGRFQKLMPGGVEVQPHPAWCWNMHGVYDTHLPERWPMCTSQIVTLTTAYENYAR